MSNEPTYQQIVDSGRNGKREPPETQFPKIAAAWNAYLAGRTITAKDVGWLMVLFKAIRESAAHDPDNLVDAHGYLYCVEKIETHVTRKRCYIAGPMRNIKLFNFPAFDVAADMLRRDGYEPVSPADIDRRAGFDPTTLPPDWDWSKIPDSLNMREIMDRDIEALKTCQCYWLLPGWENSTGAKAEVALAKLLGLERL